MTLSLYQEFNLDQNATMADIKQAYRKLALQFHPDKVPPEERESATARFQQLATWYHILSDPIKRKRYDETGSMDDMETIFGSDKDADMSWVDFFKSMFEGMVNESSIDEYAQKYRLSDEEIQDVLTAYVDNKGDMLKVIEAVPCSTLDDLSRFKEIVENGIAQGKVQEFAKFKKLTLAQLKKVKEKAKKEAKEAEKLLLEMKAEKADEDELKQMIQKRNQSRMDEMIQNLEEKASKKSTKRGKRKPEMPTEEEFEAIQASLQKKKSKK